MLRLNRVSEYALISLAYIHRRQFLRQSAEGSLAALNDPLVAVNGAVPAQLSAREIAEVHHLPYEITAKTLQKLKRMGIIDSTQGVNGGYVLAKPLSSITLAELLRGLEGEQSVVECAQHLGLLSQAAAHQDSTSGSGSPSTHLACGTEASAPVCCEFQQFCTLQPFMKMLNDRLSHLLEEIHLDEILKTEFPIGVLRNNKNRASMASDLVAPDLVKSSLVTPDVVV